MSDGQSNILSEHLQLCWQAIQPMVKREVWIHLGEVLYEIGEACKSFPKKFSGKLVRMTVDKQIVGIASPQHRNAMVGSVSNPEVKDEMAADLHRTEQLKHHRSSDRIGVQISKMNKSIYKVDEIDAISKLNGLFEHDERIQWRHRGQLHDSIVQELTEVTKAQLQLG